MSAIARLACAPIAALVLSFVVVFTGGQIAHSWSISAAATPPPADPRNPPTATPRTPDPNVIGEPIQGTFDLGTVKPDTTFVGSDLDAVVVQRGDGKYSICITPPKGTEMDVDDSVWSDHGDHGVSQYCRHLGPGGEHVMVKVTS